MKLLIAAALALAAANSVVAQELGRGSNTDPLSFGFDQVIIDLEKVEWGPLEVEGIPPGAEVAALRGSFDDGPVEAIMRLPANFTLPNHSHTSAEVYIWMTGEFTYIADDGRAVDLSGTTFISLPGSSPHGLICKDTPCMFYVRYARSFDIQIHPMPKNLKKIKLK